jgi:preprotein translocase subunit SecD
VYKKIGKPWFFIVALIIVAICYVTIAGIPGPNNGDTKTMILNGISNLRLGIDMRGGVDVTFIPANSYKASSTEMSAATTAIEQRLDAKNITDREVYTDASARRIIVRFPWKSDEKNFDPEAAIQELGATTNLNFKGPDNVVILEGKDVLSAKAIPVVSGSTLKGPYAVELTLKPSGVTKFSVATGKFVGKAISIYMDNTLISSPTVQTQITTETCSIDGQSVEEATLLANQINAGALPFSLTSESYNAISPTLGANALNVMLMAGILAFILICLFMLLYYRLPGFVAVIGLCGHLAATILMFSFPILLFKFPIEPFTLTLPGIAGIILSIGIGVDCNIITAERIKEELRAGRTLDAAIDQGFERSFSAIFDGNFTVIIVGITLMVFGSAAILSFGYTLYVGVVMNFLMGIIASRLMLKSLSKFSFLRKNVLYGEAAK